MCYAYSYDHAYACAHVASKDRTARINAKVFFFVFFQLYLYEAVTRLMAGANPTETHHLLQRSTLRQRVVTSCHHEGHHHGDAGTLALINTMSIFSFISK